MITDYSKFDYNVNFIYNHNIFKKNFNVGIGTFTPNKLLDIHGNTNINHNLNIVGNLNWITKQFNTTNIIQYIDSTGELRPIELKSYISNENTNKFEWIDNNNNLLLKIYDKRDNIINTYQSQAKIIKINSNFNLFVKSKIIIDHIFIYKTDYSYNDMSSIKINNKTLINKKNNYYYSLNEPITLNQNSYNQINITSNNVDNNDYYIILIGYYDFKKGILWNSNHDSNIFIHSNIGIKINNTNSYALNVLGSIQGNKATITQNLNCKNIISNNINTSILHINHNMTSSNNKLYINASNISIGTTKNTSFCSVGDNTTFSLNGKINTLNIKSNQVEITNNLFSSSAYIINDNLFRLNNIMIKKPSGLLTKHQDNQIYLKNNVNIKSIYQNSKLLDVKGKIKVSNNLVISNNFNIKNISNIPLRSIQSNILKNKGHVNIDKILRSKKLDSRNTNVSYIQVPKKQPILSKTISNPITTTTQQTTTTSVSNSITASYKIWRIKHDSATSKLTIIIAYNPVYPSSTQEWGQYNRWFNGMQSGSNSPDHFFLQDPNGPHQTPQNTFNFSDYSDVIRIKQNAIIYTSNYTNAAQFTTGTFDVYKSKKTFTQNSINWEAGHSYIYNSIDEEVCVVSNFSYKWDYYVGGYIEDYNITSLGHPYTSGYGSINTLQICKLNGSSESDSPTENFILSNTNSNITISQSTITNANLNSTGGRGQGNSLVSNINHYTIEINSIDNIGNLFNSDLFVADTDYPNVVGSGNPGWYRTTGLPSTNVLPAMIVLILGTTQTTNTTTTQDVTSTIYQNININYNNTGVIYYNSINDNYHGITQNKNIKFTKIKKTLDLNFKSFDFGNLLYSSINNVITHNLNINKKIILPKRSLYKSNYNSNFNKNNVGSIRFNSSALCGEIYNGYKWSKLKYENSDSEIKNIVLRSNINNLNPQFNSRITNYTATFINPSQLYLINSPYHKLIITQNNQIILNNTNNTSDFIPINHTITSNHDLQIKSESINNNLINISYNIKF